MERLITLAKVFSDLNRLKILGLILRDKEVCVCEICDTLELSQPLVSRHLRQMREAGILTSTQQGKWVIYALTDNIDPILKCWIKEMRQEIPALPKLQVCSTK